MTTIVLCANNIQELGGAQKVVHSLAQGFAERGHDVHVVGITSVENPYEYSTNYSTSYSTYTLMDRVWPLRTSTNAGLREQLRSEAVDNLHNLLSSLDSGVIISAQLWALEIALDARARVNQQQWPVIGQYHGSFAAAAAGRDIRRAQKLSPACEYFAVLSDEDRDAFALAGLTNMLVMPNPLTITPEVLEQARAISRGNSVDFVGRLSQEKGPDLLIEAWKLLADHERKLIFTGSGPMADSLQTAARELSGVEFHAPVTDPARVLAGSSVVVIPSRTEGAPLVLAEALALGTPVVVTDASSGVREMVKDNPRAILVERENPAALADGIQRALRLELDSLATFEPISNQEIYERWERVFTSVS